MKLDEKTLLLYAVTDREWLRGSTLEDQVLETVKAGTTFLQLREKCLNDKDFLEEAFRIKKIANEYNVPFVIDDNIDIAIACGADGVHVGQSDMEAGRTRERIGKDKIMGVSVQTVKQALEAEKQGADYLGVGAVFSTSTKLDASVISYDVLKEICNAVSIPVVAIGGISKKNISMLKGSGIVGVSVISAIFASDDITAATKELKEIVSDVVAK